MEEGILMRFSVIAVTLACASCMIAQTAVVGQPAQKQTQPKPGFRRAGPPGAAQKSVALPVAPTTPVVTLKGVCEDRQAKTPCETVITREDLDKYIETSAPDASKTARGRQAVQYARTLAFSALAEQQGLAKDPAIAKELDTQVKLARTRVLANAFLAKMQAQAPGVTSSDVQKYYDDHRDQYEQVQVRRLAVPFVVPTESGRPLDPKAMQSEMEELRKRVVAGEDPNQALQDAFNHLHIQATPPPANVSTLRRVVVQGEEVKLFDLKPGEVSEVLDMPAALAVYKVESKDIVPIQSARQEIEAALRRDHLQNEVSKSTKSISAQFNLQYLELPSQPDVFGGTVVSPAASRASIRPTPNNQP